MYKERSEMISGIIQAHDLSALIFWRPDELVLMLSYMPLWGLSVLVYSADHEPVLFVPELEPQDLLPSNITIKTFPWGVKDCADPWGILYNDIRELLQQKHLIKKPVSFIKSIGGTAPCRMSGEQPPLPADFTERLCNLSDTGFKDTTTDILSLYSYKTAADIVALRLTHRVTAIAVHVFYQQVNTGITESKLAALIEYAVQEMIGQHNISFARAWPMVLSGENTANGGKYNRTTGKIIASGDLVMLEMAICVNGYWADITRTAICGEASDLQLKIFETVKNAQRIAIEMLKPGVAMKEVDAASRNYIEAAEYGAYFNHALGHQVGFRYHDPGATLSPNSTEILQEGMVITIEPGIYGAELNGGVRIEDNVLITKDGYELLSAYPRSLKGD
ncbi:Xaa-Pro peptidase family protein [Pedobacter nutrimenti]|uniref:M24 family metallopeptidase n=1 Tax=Pedobacter nutrimenti TaxID=1241337 RepID=UPI00292CB71A|nr:Xaa-Pro peptidase family protein [Pedobacter nutrimenti]